MLKRVTGALNRMPGGLEPIGDKPVKEPLARFTDALSPKLTLDISPSTLPDQTGWTCLVRARLLTAGDTNSFLKITGSVVDAVRILFRVTATVQPNSARHFALDEVDNEQNLFSVRKLVPVDQMVTYLFTGDQTANIQHIYLDDVLDTSQAWDAGDWGAASYIDNTGAVSGEPGDKMVIGEGAGTATSANYDLNRLVYWTSRVIDPTSEVARRLLYDANGIPVTNMPLSPVIDLSAANGSIETNAGSLGDFTVSGTVSYLNI